MNNAVNGVYGTQFLANVSRGVQSLQSNFNELQERVARVEQLERGAPADTASSSALAQEFTRLNNELDKMRAEVRAQLTSIGREHQRQRDLQEASLYQRIDSVVPDMVLAQVDGLSQDISHRLDELEQGLARVQGDAQAHAQATLQRVGALEERLARILLDYSTSTAPATAPVTESAPLADAAELSPPAMAAVAEVAAPATQAPPPSVTEE